ncbi:TnsD family Tn7-like transposition protein [Noviherbaspirillum aridicola]|uniref:TnsD family Tn7-like transposition protein n=1 Tax=Noviherbaspirillum aridicola TaxID=2849687 RepID=UPI001C81FA7B
MLYFPRPLPDELLGSLLGRACRETGLTPTKLLFAITGERMYQSSVFLPTFLRRLASLTQSDVEYLLYGHSTFPYAVSFMPAKPAGQILGKILSAQASKNDYGSLMQTVVSGVPFRRKCDKCAEEELYKFGITYWHRSHHLPGVHYCLNHRRRLNETGIPIRRISGALFHAMPHEIDGATTHLDVSEDLLSEVAVHSVKALEYRGTHADTYFWLSRFRELAESKGYVKSSTFVATRLLAHDVLSAFGTRFLTEAGCNYTPDNPNAWPARLVRPCTKPEYSAPKHILLFTFLSTCGNAASRVQYRKPGPKSKCQS